MAPLILPKAPMAGQLCVRCRVRAAGSAMLVSGNKRQAIKPSNLLSALDKSLCP